MTPTQQETTGGGSVASLNKAGRNGKDSDWHDSTAPLRGQDGISDLALVDAGALLAAMTVDREDATQEERTGRFHLMHADELTALPPVKWLVKGEIPEEGFAVLYGPSGAGKSTIALDLAFRVSATRPVVYVAAEGSGGYAARVLAWQKHHKRTAGSLYFLTESVNLLDPKERAGLLGALGTITPSLCIIDTLARCMIGGDENSARDMGLAIDALDDVRRLTGAAVLVVHHTGKSGASERGSSALRGAADAMLELSESDGVITLTVSKTKDSAPNPNRHMRLVTVETGRFRDDGEPETACVALPSDKVYRGDELTKNERTLLKALALEVFRDTGARAAALQQSAPSVPNGSFHRTLSRLMAKGFATQGDKGEPYRITADGLLAAGDPLSD